MRKVLRILGITVCVIAVKLTIIITLLAFPSLSSREQQYGVTFSQFYAEDLSLDWKETYEALLSDLGVRRLRLSAYWNAIEPEEGSFDFADLDYQLSKAEEYNAEVILSIGRKLPRWPECHEPEWAQGFPEEEKQEKILAMLEVVVQRYTGHPAIVMWQLENEPLFSFGVCPPSDADFLRREERLVRSLDDHNKPILVTDSGELSTWLGAASFGDVLGTTMYRTVFSGKIDDYFFYDYIFPSWLYRVKSRYVRLLKGKSVIISELQGEPWGPGASHDLPAEERLKSFSPERFRQLRAFARRTQFSEAYWWGVEYWYWEKTVEGNSEYWDIAREIF